MGIFIQWLLLAAVIDNLVLNRLLGLPVLAGRTRTPAATRRVIVVTGMALAVSLPACWLLHYYVLQPLALTHLRIVFVSLLALLCVRLVAVSTHRRVDDDLTATTALSAGTVVVLGAALSEEVIAHSLLHAVAAGLGGAAGFAVAMLALEAMAERIATAPVPVAFRGTPVSLLAAGLLALGLAGFGSP